MRFAPRLIAVLMSISFIACLEWGAQSWTRAKGTPFHNSLRLLETDSQLGWRQRRNLETVFLGAPVKTDGSGLRIAERPQSGKASRRVLILGPSSTFGWGVPYGETYASALRDRLNELAPGSSWEVVNAGQIGYSSWQGVRLLEEILRRDRRWDWIVLAYGVNDVDRHRFFFESAKPDSLALGQGPPARLLGVLNMINQWDLARLFASGVNKARDAFGCRWVTDDGPGLARVSRAEFIENNRRLAAAARASGARVLFLTTATSYRAAPGDQPRAQAALREGIARYHARDYAQARSRFDASLAYDNGQSEALFWLSLVESRQRRCSQARDHFEKARRQERSHIAREVDAYNRALIALARKEDIPWIALEAVVPAARPEYFFDPVHFSPSGHKRIAAELLATIAPKRKSS